MSRRCVGTERVEHGVPECEQAGETDEQIERGGEDDVDAHHHRDMQDEFHRGALSPRAGEQALRPDQQHHEQQDEGDGVLPLGGDFPKAEAFHQADQIAAGD